MITKERFEQLIDEGKEFYWVIGNDIRTLGNLSVPTYWKSRWDLYGEDCFETLEDAEWHCEFRRIPRTEYLDLPNWEEFNKKGYFKFSAKDGRELVIEQTLIIDFESEDFTNYELNILDTNDYDHKSLFKTVYTEDNYKLICRKAINLFLGKEN